MSGLRIHLDKLGLGKQPIEVVGHFIDGQFVDSIAGETFTNLAPASDELICDVAHGRTADIERAVQASEAALKGAWGKTSVHERAAIVRRLGDLILTKKDDLARLEALDTGKPFSETSTGDIPRAAHNCHFFAELAAHQTQPAVTGADGSLHVTQRDPLGVVGLITPWNLPLYLASWKLAPALIQGNAVILKPAELTPLSAAALGPLLNEAGVPPGVVNIVQGFGPESAGEALVAHPGVRAISFTGETRTGEAIMRTAASGLKKLSFELGGKGATVIFPSADLDKAAATAARAAFRNQGQICLAGSRLIVHRKVAETVVGKILQHIKAIKIGDPLDEATTMGSLIGKAHRDKVASYVELAKTEPGCEILCGGKIPVALSRGAYFEPTVITGVAQSSRLIQEEIFGPVLTVQVFDDFDEAMTMLNGTPYGLSCSLWTNDTHEVQRATKAARHGLVWVNCWFVRDLHTAFGGQKRSGIGREGGQYSLDFFAELKTVTYGI